MGRSTARLFAEEGATLVLADVNASVATVFDEIQARYKCDGFTMVVDVRSADDCHRLIAETINRFERIDVLAFFAGVVGQAVEVADLDEREWNRVIDVNLNGAFLVMRAAARAMRAQRHGRIVAIASDWGRTGMPLFGAYCASKAGLIVLTQSLAAEVARSGVTANTIAPSLINTGMHESALRDEAAQRGVSFESFRDAEWDKVPIGRAGEPEDVGRAVLFLASDDAKYITGASLDVGGGLMRR
jgi:NAD(P)-dependent dehydrogenase (short-subunit alcohol dehydrogenase family)